MIKDDFIKRLGKYDGSQEIEKWFTEFDESVENKQFELTLAGKNTILTEDNKVQLLRSKLAGSAQKEFLVISKNPATCPKTVVQWKAKFASIFATSRAAKASLDYAGCKQEVNETVIKFAEKFKDLAALAWEKLDDAGLEIILHQDFPKRLRKDLSIEIQKAGL